MKPHNNPTPSRWQPFTNPETAIICSSLLFMKANLKSHMRADLNTIITELLAHQHERLSREATQ